MKYTKEAQFLEGVAMVKIDSGDIGIKLLLLDYTYKKVVSIIEYQKLLDKEIYRIKLLTLL